MANSVSLDAYEYDLLIVFDRFLKIRYNSTTNTIKVYHILNGLPAATTGQL